MSLHIYIYTYIFFTYLFVHHRFTLRLQAYGAALEARLGEEEVLAARREADDAVDAVFHVSALAIYIYIYIHIYIFF